MMLSVRGVNVNLNVWNETFEDTLILLHGFTGSVATWEPIAALLPTDIRIIAIDLLGHGKTDAPSNPSRYLMEEQVKDLEDVFSALDLKTFSLLGYSMGGRVALSYAEAYPGRIKQLILESASPGLKTEEERLSRRKADEQLADKIEKDGLIEFVNKWENIPLFHSQKKLPSRVQNSIRIERLSQKEIGLAGSLRGMGTGAQKSLWSKLNQLKMPVYLLTGELDVKFCNIAMQMKKQLDFGEHIIIKNVGHAIHVENPTQFATIVKDILTKY
ncbi:esterase [Ureibacillus massiliensis 4400831 = CIP 108448 = CCUG 49529]|uniref:Putative 2-succinyl-6-hydroxy-2,4-cyclohexadiene-1-carboxylate synthase n=1 Tax=Ureibacillus massiliensis 4400831 = CIP 108448 = CCUG 49529 TaxID=1211035 RepID=A0A0A3IVV7_9BACL|nr:esterase [Ureibacillus massiliensis 4400831 = CIP 108448 = CCUG 49529]